MGSSYLYIVFNEAPENNTSVLSYVKTEKSPPQIPFTTLIPLSAFELCGFTDAFWVLIKSVRVQDIILQFFLSKRYIFFCQKDTTSKFKTKNKSAKMYQVKCIFHIDVYEMFSKNPFFGSI